MRIDFDRALTTLDGEALKYAVEACSACGRPREERSRTLRNACVDGLMATSPQDQAITGEEKVRRYQLAVRIHEGGVVEVSPEDVVLVRERVALLFGSIVVGQVWPMLESGAAGG